MSRVCSLCCVNPRSALWAHSCKCTQRRIGGACAAQALGTLELYHAAVVHSASLCITLGQAWNC